VPLFHWALVLLWNKWIEKYGRNWLSQVLLENGSGGGVAKFVVIYLTFIKWCQ